MVIFNRHQRLFNDGWSAWSSIERCQTVVRDLDECNLGVSKNLTDTQTASENKTHQIGASTSQGGLPQIRVVFNIDADGTIHVSATDKETGYDRKIVVQSSGDAIEDDLVKKDDLREKFIKIRELLASIDGIDTEPTRPNTSSGRQSNGTHVGTASGKVFFVENHLHQQHFYQIEEFQIPLERIWHH